MVKTLKNTSSLIDLDLKLLISSRLSILQGKDNFKRSLFYDSIQVIKI